MLKSWGELEVVECWWKELPITLYTSSQPFQINVYLPDSRANSCSSGLMRLSWWTGRRIKHKVLIFFRCCGIRGKKLKVKCSHVSTSLKLQSMRIKSEGAAKVTSHTSHQGATPYRHFKPDLLPVVFVLEHFTISAPTWIGGLRQTCNTYFREETQEMAILGKKTKMSQLTKGNLFSTLPETTLDSL